MFVAFFSRAPFLRLILSLSAGIFIQLYIPLKPLNILTAAGLLALMLFISEWLPVYILFRYNWLRGLFLQLLLVCSGSLLVFGADVRHNSHYFGLLARPGDLLLVTLKEPLQQKERSFKTLALVSGIVRGDQQLPAVGKLLVYLPKDSVSARLQYGDRLLIAAAPTQIGYSANPGAFDYRQYCARQQIYRQVFLRAGKWRLLPGRSEGLLMRTLLRSREYCLHTLQQYIGGKEAGLAAALLIGYRYDLDREMVQEYTNTGIVHIIAISGMHLALIYGGLLWIFSWWPRHRYSEMLKGLLIIALLWAFTLLTGGAASVLRASVMFSFMTVGKFMLDRYTNIYNTLSASAFLLLCYDPYLLMDAGFQLSYLAVLSIVICYRNLYRLLQCRNRWLDKLWDMIALTLAAQVLTLPVCLYYFHQFPLYFLPANMLAVPLSTLVLYGEICLLLIGGIPIAAHWTGAGLRWAMEVMNTVVGWIGQLPGALITDIRMPSWAVGCLYLCIAGLLVWWLHQRREGLLVALVAMAVWSAGTMFIRLHEQQQRSMLIYNVPGHTFVDVVEGHQVRSTGDVVLLRDVVLYNRYLQSAHLLYGVQYGKDSCIQIAGTEAPLAGSIVPVYGERGTERKTVKRDAAFAETIISLPGQRRLVIVDKPLPRIRLKKKFRTNYLLLSHNPQVDIRQLEEMYEVGCYIFDASSSLQHIQRWKSDCYMLTLRFFSVPDQGAFVVNF